MPTRNRKSVVIHAGIHRTGSTSIQRFLDTNREKLRSLDIDFYTGEFIPSNHAELHAAAMRRSRDSHFKRKFQVRVDEQFRARLRRQITEYIETSPCPCVVFSAEGLSYLHHEDEMERLRELMGNHYVEIVLYLRNRDDFLRSYRRELKYLDLPARPARDSFAYTESDSWLVDFELRIAAFRRAFGANNVHLINYDEELAGAGNIIPSFLQFLGVDAHFASEDWHAVFLNQSDRTRERNQT